MRSLITKVLKSLNMDYEFNPPKQPSHKNFRHNCAKLHSDKVFAIASRYIIFKNISEGLSTILGFIC